MLLDNKIDIALGSETHLRPHISDNEFLQPSYACYRRDMDDGFDGAIIIITKTDLIVEEMVMSEKCEFLAIKIQTCRPPSSSLEEATAHRPPSSSLEEAGNISNELTKLNIKYKINPDMVWGRHELARYQLEDKLSNKNISISRALMTASWTHFYHVTSSK